jgi:hypothetical protein
MGAECDYYKLGRRAMMSGEKLKRSSRVYVVACLVLRKTSGLRACPTHVQTEDIEESITAHSNYTGKRPQLPPETAVKIVGIKC